MEELSMRKIIFVLMLALICRPAFPQEVQKAPQSKDYQFSKTLSLSDQRIRLWTDILSSLKGKPGINYLEVGVYEGQSFFWMLDNIFTDESNKAVAVDPFPSSIYNTFMHNLEKSGYSQRVTVIKGYSQDKLREMPANQFDVIYVDGDHRAPAVLSDAVMSWYLLRNGGFLIFDDYLKFPEMPPELNPEVAIDSFLTVNRNDLKVIYKGNHLICQKTESGYANSYARYTVFGDYFYVWSENVKQQGLFDKNAKKIPLRPEEDSMIQSIILGRKFGQVEIKVDPKLLEDQKFIQLRDKLRLRISGGVITRTSQP
jgi:predicted O-methyltransferase YrrM